MQPTNPTQSHLQKTFFRSAVGKQLACPGCKEILDCSRAVESTVTEKATDQIQFCRVYCAKCYDHAVGPVMATYGRDPQYDVEIVDGRELSW